MNDMKKMKKKKHPKNCGVIDVAAGEAAPSVYSPLSQPRWSL